MKYFTFELWKKMNSGDKSLQEAAFSEWDNNINKYEAYLHSIAKKMPRNTMAAIIECTETLHDFDFVGVSFNSKWSHKRGCHMRRYLKRDCCLKLTDGVMNVELVLRDVIKFRMEVEYGKVNRTFEVRWGYCEFSYEKPNLILSILFDSGNVWEFKFSSLTIKKTNV